MCACVWVWGGGRGGDGMRGPLAEGLWLICSSTKPKPLTQPVATHARTGCGRTRRMRLTVGLKGDPGVWSGC